MNEPRLLEFLFDEERGGDISSVTICAEQICIAFENAIAPVVEATLVRLASEDVQVLLTDKIFRCVEWIYIVSGGQPRKGSFGLVSKLTERSIEWIEVIVHP